MLSTIQLLPTLRVAQVLEKQQKLMLDFKGRFLD